MKLFFKKFFFVFIFIVCIFFITSNLFLSHFTTGISVKENRLICDSYIPLLGADNISDFYETHAKEDNTSLESMICSMDKAFDGSDKDRVLLFKFAHKNLRFWLVQRHDISDYFYQKIISSHPNDALSFYIRDFELNK